MEKGTGKEGRVGPQLGSLDPAVVVGDNKNHFHAAACSIAVCGTTKRMLAGGLVFIQLYVIFSL